jgi:hypothetical protein
METTTTISDWDAGNYTFANTTGPINIIYTITN